MTKYILRRLLQSIPVLLGITLITFTAASLAPGDPVTLMTLNLQAGAFYDPININELREAYGLNQPLPIRYLRWLGGLLRGNLGMCVRGGMSVSEAIRSRIPATFELALTAMLISFSIGIPLGILCAVKRNSWFDYAVTTWTFLGISIPGFFVGMIAIYTLAVGLRWFPTGGFYSIPLKLGPKQPWYVYTLDHLWYLVLPALVLAWESIAGISRYTRSSVLDVLKADYVVTARGKGLRNWAVLSRHVLRNALLPIITLFALRIPSLFSGAALIEVLFAWPGIAPLASTGISQRDYPLIMGINLITSVLVVFSNLFADVLYGIADPRIRFQ